MGIKYDASQRIYCLSSYQKNSIYKHQIVTNTPYWCRYKRTMVLSL
jgi:hypothetical protein